MNGIEVKQFNVNVPVKLWNGFDKICKGNHSVKGEIVTQLLEGYIRLNHKKRDYCRHKWDANTPRIVNGKNGIPSVQMTCLKCGKTFRNTPGSQWFWKVGK